jgi:ABC-type Fe3+/spermidine/putrescine transport system ATPase subunit
MNRPLELRGLTKSFGSVLAVDDVDLRLDPGEFLTLLGPSGSGKTTILRMIAGFQQPSSGSILIDGRDVSVLSPAERGVGFVFQHYALFPHMSVRDNVAYPLRMRHVSKRERALHAGGALELVRLEGFGDRLPAELSGGEQQRVALARALIFGPRVLLMDEPLGALDRGLRIEMEKELRRIHRETRVTVVYVTHDQEEALILSDRIGVLRAGKLLQEGTPRELFETPANEFVARFFGECNLLPIEVQASNGSVRWAFGHDGAPARTWAWPSPAGGRQDCPWVLMVRPADVWVGPANGARSEAVSVRAVIDDVVYLGTSMRLNCTTREFGRLLAEAPAHAAAGMRPGDEVALSFDPAAARPVPADER